MITSLNVNTIFKKINFQRLDVVVIQSIYLNLAQPVRDGSQ